MSTVGLLCGELRPRALDRRASAFTVAAMASAPARACSARSFETMPLLDQLRLALRGQRRVFGVRAVAAELRFGLAEERLIAQQVGFGLPERRLERPLVDREQQLILLDEVALLEGRLLDLSGYLRPDRNHGVRFDVADGGDVHRDVALDDFRGHDRTAPASPPRPRPPRPPPPVPSADPEQPAAAVRRTRLEIRMNARFCTNELQAEVESGWDPNANGLS